MYSFHFVRLLVRDLQTMFLPLLILQTLLALPVSAYYRPGPSYGNNFGVPVRNATYDYVVVGGGTAGLALASRLAENGSYSVAVIEAGGFYEVDNGNTSVVPNLGLIYTSPLLLFKDAYPTVDWGIVTTNQTGLVGQQYHYGRGRTLGGTSALNSLVYHRGTYGFHQQWANLVEDPSYEFDNMLPYFQRSATYTAPQMDKRPANASVPKPASNAYSDDGGPLEIGYINWPLPFGSWAKLAFDELGFESISDFNHGILTSKHQYLTQCVDPDMKRSSSQASYLDWALDSQRQNLITYTRTLAKRIVFDGDLRATGVEVTTMGIPYLINATREVIVSGGAINSPQLLMVSGIGPAETLSSLSIPVLIDHPGVGQNLWDHVLFTLTHQVNVQGGTRLNIPEVFQQAQTDYKNNATGPMSNTGFDFVAWEKLPAESRANLSEQALSDLDSFPSDWPELEFIIGDAQIPTDPDLYHSYASVIGGLIAPLSRGNVTITSADTSDLPVFDPAWLTHPTDREVAVQAFRRCRAVFNTTALRPVLIGPEVVPGADVQTDEEILAYIEQSATTIYHAAGTCKMGSNTDPMAVLDSKARVRGAKALRVVDASSFPLLLPGHPQGTIYALAEKIAEDILLGR
jgi:choline dehydrogenase